LKAELEINIIKKTCKELGITQKELAEKIGISYRTISRYTSNKNIPTYLKKYILLIIENQQKTEMINNLKDSIENIQKIIK